MIPIWTQIAVIAVVNAVAHMTLVYSIRCRSEGKFVSFAGAQAIGYSLFVAVFAGSYDLLLTQPAHLMVVVVALNYSVTINCSRSAAGVGVDARSLQYDALLLAGVAVFALGGSWW